MRKLVIFLIKKLSAILYGKPMSEETEVVDSEEQEEVVDTPEPDKEKTSEEQHKAKYPHLYK